MQIQPIEFGSKESQLVLTCSTCINNSLLDSWSFSWATSLKKAEIETKQLGLGIDNATIASVHKWTDIKYDDEKAIGWCNVFFNTESAIKYYRIHFSHLKNIKLISLYFDKFEAQEIIAHFEPANPTQGTIGIVEMLQKRIDEDLNNEEKTIGYDILGIELGGDFHTFHCHDLSDELIAKFGLAINSYGLFEDTANWKDVVDYMNDENNGFEPVPWFLAKVKLVETLPC